jgi:hypothetical protein
MSFGNPPFGAPSFGSGAELPPAPAIGRHLGGTVLQRLQQFPAAALLGPRQVGKTTLAKAVAARMPSVYLDLERPSDRQLLADPELYLSAQRNKLVILDEVQREPNLFQILRGLIDEGRRLGIPSGQFLLLGSASGDLLRQSSESLAGRISYLELGPFDVREVNSSDQDRLWNRGGFPESFLAVGEAASLIWRENFIRTYLERDIPFFAPRLPSETLRRFWTMLANQQGGLFNAAEIARGLGIEGKSVARYLDLLVDLFLVRRLAPYFVNTGKRLVKSPKIFVRDSGLVHALLSLGSLDRLLGHPVVGGSWEGFVIENLIASCPSSTVPGFYRTAAGAEVDLVLEFPGGALWVMEIKRGLAPALTKGYYNALDDLKPERAFLVHAGGDRYPVAKNVEAIGVRELAALLATI